jgi:hypothetical protein
VGYTKEKGWEDCAYHLLPKSILNTINNAMAITSAAEYRL